jgi:PAS domain S-box-containing protein
MNDGMKTKKQLIDELTTIRKRMVESEASKDKKEFQDSIPFKNNEIFRCFVENANDIVFSLTPDGVFTYVSPNWTEILGHDIHKVVGQPLEAFVHTEDIPLCRAFMAQVVATGEKQGGIEYRVHHESGPWRWHATNASPVRDADGNIISYMGIARDITDRKLVEEALRESEEQYRLVVENAGEAIVIDQDGMHKFVNRRAVEILGYSKEELTSRPFIEFVHPDDREMVLERYTKRMKGEGVPNIYPLKITDRDGAVKWIEIHPTLISWQGKPATLNFFNDITDRKRAEEEKRGLEEHLQHANKMEAIGTLAGGVAHDFNNLLMGIQGYVSLTLLDLDSSHPHYERLKGIEEQVASGADLTRQLLGFARGGRYEVKPADMNDVLEKTSSMFGRTKKEISIHRKYGKDLFTVEVDQGQMEQVFMNLYVNAWQAMPEGGEIYLETEDVILNEAKAFTHGVKLGKYVKITVTDTGIGMDEATKERIFEPFFTTKTMGKGTGLGLATVYGIIKGHGGMINVYSEPGNGTTFNIYLPASEKEVVKAETATEQSQGVQRQSSWWMMKKRFWKLTKNYWS